jgi:hypothetical protein
VLRHGDAGLTIDASIFDQDGEFVGTINNSGYNIPYEKDLIVEHSGDLSQLVVHNKHGDESLYIHYMNQNTVRIRGVFACPPYRGVLTITNKGTIPALAASDSCMENAPGPAIFIHRKPLQ